MPDWPVRQLPTVSAALRDINSSNEEARLAAIAALTTAKNDGERQLAQQALIRALEDSSAKIRAQAALALAEIGPLPALSQLRDLVDDPDGRVAQAAIIALGETRSIDALETLKKALDSKNADLRFQAVLAVANVAGTDAIELLRRYTSDEDPEVRANVAAAFADLDAEAGLELLKKLINDSDFAVRLEAAIALAKKGDRRATPVLIEALHNDDVAPQAVHGLGLLRDPDALEPLRSLSKRWLARAPLRASATAALAALGDKEGEEELPRWLAARRREPRAMAIYCSGEFRVESAVGPLCALLDDPMMTDRDGIARALGLIGDKKALQALTSACSDPDQDVADEARQALENLGAPYR